MTFSRSVLSTALIALLLANVSQAAAAARLYDEKSVLVTGSHRYPRDCPTCYKGHDFGSDCFQYVWTGFEQVWTNVCLWGWH